MIAILYTILIILDASSDAFFFLGDKGLSKIIEVVFKIGIFAIPLLYKKYFNVDYIVNCGLIYLFLHMAIFDLTFNLIAGLGVNFVGTTTPIYDTLMSQLTDFWWWFYRAFCIFTALLLYFRFIHKNKIVG